MRNKTPTMLELHERGVLLPCYSRSELHRSFGGDFILPHMCRSCQWVFIIPHQDILNVVYSPVRVKFQHEHYGNCQCLKHHN